MDELDGFFFDVGFGGQEFSVGGRPSMGVLFLKELFFHLDK